MSGECNKCGEHALDCSCKERKNLMYEESFFDLIRDATYMLKDRPPLEAALIYYVAKMEPELRGAIVIAYERYIYDETNL